MGIDSIQIEERGTSTQEINDFVSRSPEEIEREFIGESGNPWLACFGSRVFGLRGWIELANSKKIIPQEQIKKITKQLQSVKDQLNMVKNEHGWNPPPKIRQKLLLALKSIIIE